MALRLPAPPRARSTAPRVRAALPWVASIAALLFALPVCARNTAAVEEAPAGRFDYYVLTLSWSPAYCASRPNDRSECGTRRFAFVLHDLWPQYASGGFPAHCGAAGAVPPAVIERALAVIPSTGLIRHEWSTHGTCSGLAPGQYFDLAERAFRAIRIPPIFESAVPPQDLPAEQIARAFVAANPRLAAADLALRCRGPELEEVRVCLSRDLVPTACGRDVHTQCRRGPVRILPLR
ncbi:MAG TPA: ribonuclease T2 [Burkholderiaceae bacterium]